MNYDMFAIGSPRQLMHCSARYGAADNEERGACIGESFLLTMSLDKHLE